MGLIFSPGSDAILKDLEDYSARRRKCEELLQTPVSPEVKSQLEAKMKELNEHIDRLSLCSDILSGRCELKVSGDFMEVKFEYPGRTFSKPG